MRFGRGELGREGGSWAGAGVLAPFDIVCDVEVEAVRMRFGVGHARTRRDGSNALAKVRGLRWNLCNCDCRGGSVLLVNTQDTVVVVVCFVVSRCS